MMAADLPRTQVIRLDAGSRPWRLPREADLQLGLINVALAKKPGDPGIPFSFVALPGHYLSALLDFSKAWQTGGALLVLNPAWDVPPDGVWAMLAELAEQALAGEHQAPQVQVLADFTGQVLGYWFHPGGLQPDGGAGVLRDLSGFDPALDLRLLQALGLDAKLLRVRTPPGMLMAPAQFSFPTLGLLAGHVARARLAALHAGKPETWAVITHHAGDLLLALKVIEAHPHGVQGVVTHADYVDIVRDVLPDMPVMGVEAPMPARGQAWARAHALNDELLYFERHVLPVLPPDRAILFLRPVRGYESAAYSFAAQLAFVVAGASAMAGFPCGSALSAQALLSRTGTVWPRVRGKRVLLHFDGGWPIKIYPQQARNALIRALQERQWSVSVAGTPAGLPEGVPVHPFTGLAALRSLLEAHDVLVGMDSFPCHYASRHLAMPVVCLFGPTSQPHLAHDAPHYVALSRALPCAPCHSYSHCPEYGGSQCRNFVDPDTVVSVLERCLYPAP